MSLTQVMLALEQLRVELMEIDGRKAMIDKQRSDTFMKIVDHEQLVHDAVSGHCPGDVVEVSDVLYKVELVNLRRKLVPFTPRKLQ